MTQYLVDVVDAGEDTFAIIDLGLAEGQAAARVS
jgi:hypothetical protein